MSAPPIPTRWDGEAFVPLPRFQGLADEHFVIGQVYQLVEVQERSQRSHAHYFASVTEAWANLPEHLAGRFRSADALRKEALINTGHCDAEVYVCKFKTEARRLAAALQGRDDFAVVVVDGKVVTRYTAKSQDMKSMGKDTFQKSKDDVLGYLSGLIGVEVGQLQQARAA